MFACFKLFIIIFLFATTSANAAVILAYHRVGQDEYPNQSIKTSQFLEHMKTIVDGGYNVARLEDVVDALSSGRELPDKTIVITFEGGYRSILDSAVPFLRKNKLPFTVFYSSDLAARNSSAYLNWSDLKAIKKYEGASFGILPASYKSLINMPQNDIKALVNRAKAAHYKNLKRNPNFFSYPFGEYSLDTKKAIEESEFKAAFTLNSGAAHNKNNVLELPRFSMTQKYSDIDRFKLVIDALPLVVDDETPVDSILSTANPSIGFSIGEDYENFKKLQCFVSDESPPDIIFLSDKRVELRLKSPIFNRRTRLNCTMPYEKNGHTRWRWHGRLLLL